MTRGIFAIVIGLLGLLLVACGTTLAEDEGISPTIPAQAAVNEGSPTSTRDSVPQSDPLLAVGNAAPKLASTGYEVGDFAPAFVLPSSGGPSRSLEMFRQDKNIILVIYYAFW